MSVASRCYPIVRHVMDEHNKSRSKRHRKLHQILAYSEDWQTDSTSFASHLYQKIDCWQHGRVALFLDVAHYQFEDVRDPLRVQLQELGAAQEDVALQYAHGRLQGGDASMMILHDWVRVIRGREADMKPLSKLKELQTL
jgi:hypothetical protein